MSQRRRLVYFTLLNILISACVTGTFLFFYDRLHRSSGSSSGVANLPASITSPVPSGVRLEILSVIGAGTASSEIVVVQNVGEEAVVLTGWYLQDGEGNSYRFPQLTLYAEGSAQVHTTSGADTAVDLYWGRVHAVWQSGEVATLVDPQGSPHAFYRVP